MKYPDDFLNKIIHADCLDVMPSIPDQSVDFILADLPYGQTAPEWDKLIDIKALWVQYKRILRENGAIALFSSQPFSTLIIGSNIEDYRYSWYWIKNQGTNFFHAKRMPIRKVEEINIFGKAKIYNPQITDGHEPTRAAKGCSNGQAYFGKNKRDYAGGSTTRLPTNVLEFKCVNNYKRLHSSEKPVELCEYLIKTYTDAGMVVLDNVIGSGTTAVACVNMGRNFIGIEKDEKYYQIAVERMHKNIWS